MLYEGLVQYLATVNRSKTSSGALPILVPPFRTAFQCLRLSVDDINERRLQASTTNKEAINVALRSQLLAVLLVNATAIDDPGLIRRILADIILQPLADRSVNLLRLFRSSDLASANSPDGLVGNDYFAPVADLVSDCLQLCCYDVDCLVAFALFKGLAAAPDNADATVESRFGLAGDELCITWSVHGPLLNQTTRRY